MSLLIITIGERNTGHAGIKAHLIPTTLKKPAEWKKFIHQPDDPTADDP